MHPPRAGHGIALQAVALRYTHATGTAPVPIGPLPAAGLARRHAWLIRSVLYAEQVLDFRERESEPDGRELAS